MIYWNNRLTYRIEIEENKFIKNLNIKTEVEEYAGDRKINTEKMDRGRCGKSVVSVYHKDFIVSTFHICMVIRKTYFNNSFFLYIVLFIVILHISPFSFPPFIQWLTHSSFCTIFYMDSDKI